MDFKWEAEKSTGFTEWWETNDWAAKLRDNLAKDLQGWSNISPPRWDSKATNGKALGSIRSRHKGQQWGMINILLRLQWYLAAP